MKNLEPTAIRSGIVGFAMSNPYFIVVVCLIVTILGTLCVVKLPKDLLPSSNQPAVQVLSFYGGMPVDHVAADLSTRFELYTGQAIGIERQESKSLVGVSIVKNFFGGDTDLNTAISQTTALVMSVLRKLPPGTQPPLIMPFDPMATTPLALVAVSGDLPEKNLYDIATYKVRTAVQAVPGAMAPTVMGGAERQIVVYLDPNKLRNFNLSSIDILNRVTNLNTFIPTGDIKMGDFDYPILSNGLADKIDDMNDFPIRSDLGTAIYLKQVGEAKDASKIQTNVVMVDGKRQVYVPIFRQPGSNSIQVVDSVKSVIGKLSQHLKEVKLTLVADQSVFIRHAIESIAEETVIGGGLAALLVLLFLGNPRATLGLLLTIPLSLLISFLGLQATGQTLNAMTLGGLALAIGVLVDNSIVVLENVSNKIEEGMPVWEAAYEGTSEVAMPVLASTLATLVVLFPVVFLSGMVKILFSALAKSVMFAMVGSYLTAMTVMPIFAAKFLKSKSDAVRLPAFFILMEKGMQKVISNYGRALEFALQNGRKIILGLVVVLPIIVVLLAPKIGTELFPRADAGNFMFEVRLPSGTRIEKTAEFAKEMDAKLREWIPASDLKMIISNAGLIYGFPAAFTPNTGTQDVFFNIELQEDRKHTTQDYAKIIREKLPAIYPELTYNIELGGLLSSALNGGLPSPIDIQVEGPNQEKSAAIANELLVKIKSLKGAVQARVQQRFDTPQIQLNFDRKKSMELGINTEEVVKNVVSAVSGSSTFSPTIWVDPKSGVDYLLGVQFNQNQVSSLDQLKNIPITGRRQERGVPLSRITTISENTGPSEINHVNLKTVIDLYVDAADRDVGGLSRDIEKEIKAYAWPEGYSAEVRGEISEMNGSVNSLGGGFLLAAILVYLILVVQFKSFGTPLIIMATVPMGMVGIVMMLAATHTYFSIQAAIGAIFMIGIAVANGVLLIEFILHKAREGGMNNESILAGAKARLRPILMTSMASVLGLVPMAVGLGHGSEANIPLGRAVIGGQLLSVTLTLFVIPILVKLFLEKPAARLAAPAMILMIALGLSPHSTFAATPATAASPAPVINTLTPEFILQKALGESPALQAIKLDEEASEQAVGVERANYFPTLDFQALDSTGFPGSTSYLGIGGLMGSPYRSGISAGLVSHFTVYDFGRTGNRVDAAKSQVEVSRANSELSLQSVKQQALLHLIECAHFQSLKRNWDEITTETDVVRKEVEKFVKTGQSSVVDKYLVESQVEEAKTQSSDYLNRAKDELQSIQDLTGNLEGRECPFIDELSFKDQAPAGEQPMVKKYRAELQVAQKRVDIARADLLPEVVAMGSVGALEEARLVNKQDYSVAIGLEFPIFEGFKTTHAIHEARARSESQQLGVEAAQQEVRIRNHEYDLSIHSAQLRLSNLNHELDLAKTGVDVAKKRYFGYEGKVIDLREALRDLIRVENQISDSKRDLDSAVVQKLSFNGQI